VEALENGRAAGGESIRGNTAAPKIRGNTAAPKIRGNTAAPSRLLEILYEEQRTASGPFLEYQNARTYLIRREEDPQGLFPPETEDSATARESHGACREIGKGRIAPVLAQWDQSIPFSSYPRDVP
jgi:hypothetical protein